MDAGKGKKRKINRRWRGSRRDVLCSEWLAHRIHDRARAEVAARHLSGKLMDIGCGEKPYESLLEHHVSEHVGLDIADTLHGLSKVDIVGAAYDIPVADASFDYAICMAVLEHLEDPGSAIREARRVLKPEGKAIHTAPLFRHVREEPRDFYRYTECISRHFCSEDGFEILFLKPLSGLIVTFGQELVYYLHGIAGCGKGGLRRFAVAWLGAAIQLVACLLSGVYRDHGFAWM